MDKMAAFYLEVLRRHLIVNFVKLPMMQYNMWCSVM